MPATTQSVPIAVLASSSRQHTAASQELARRAINSLVEVQKQLRDERPAMPAARAAAAELMELIAELGKLSEDVRFTGQARQRVAA